MSALAPIPTPQQRRSRKTLQRILDAFERALETRTFEEVTVGALCEQAGCSVGTFYGRVESKDVLLDHLRQRVYDEVRDSLRELFSPERAQEHTLSSLIREQMAALVDIHLARRGVIRAVIVHARRHPAFAEHTRVFNATLLQQVAGSWLTHQGEIVHPDPAAAVEHATLMAAGYLREGIIFSELWPSKRAADPGTHLQNLHHLLVAFLLGRPPTPGDTR